MESRIEGRYSGNSRIKGGISSVVSRCWCKSLVVVVGDREFAFQPKIPVLVDSA